MTGRDRAELIARARRGAAIRPTGPAPEGFDAHAAMFAAVTRVLARRMVEANRP